MFRISEPITGTASKLVWILSTRDRLEASPAALPNSRPCVEIVIGLRTVNAEALRAVTETGPASVIARDAMSPCTSRLKQISSSSGTSRSVVVRSTVRVPRTSRPMTTSWNGPVSTVAPGRSFSRNC